MFSNVQALFIIEQSWGRSLGSALRPKYPISQLHTRIIREQIRRPTRSAFVSIAHATKHVS